MALEFATAQQRLGQSVIRRTANARAVLGEAAGPRITVDGKFNDAPGSSAAGTFSARVRDLTFRCLTADLAIPVDEGTPVAIYRDDQLAQALGSYKVLPGGRVDQPENGQTVLALEVAA